jgi:hypothetical protein
LFSKRRKGKAVKQFLPASRTTQHHHQLFPSLILPHHSTINITTQSKSLSSTESEGAATVDPETAIAKEAKWEKQTIAGSLRTSHLLSFLPPDEIVELIL